MWHLALACVFTLFALTSSQGSNSFGLGDVLVVTSVTAAGSNDTLRPCRLLTFAEAPASNFNVQVSPYTGIDLPRQPGESSQGGVGRSSWLPFPQQPCTLPGLQWFGQLASAASSDSGLVSFACYGHAPGSLLSAATSAVAALVRNDGAIDTSTRFVLPRTGTFVFGAVTDDGSSVWFATDEGVYVLAVGATGPGAVLQEPLAGVVRHLTAHVLGSGAFLLATMPGSGTVIAVRRDVWPPPQGNSTLSLPRSAADVLTSFPVTAGNPDTIFGHAALAVNGAWANSVFVASTADNRFNVIMFDHDYDDDDGSFSNFRARRSLTINSQEVMRAVSVVPGASRNWKPRVVAAGARTIGAHVLIRYNASAEQSTYTDVLHEVPGVEVLPPPYMIHGVASAPQLLPLPPERSSTPQATIAPSITNTATQSGTATASRSPGGPTPATPSVSTSRMRGAVGPQTLVLHRIGTLPSPASTPGASPSRGAAASASPSLPEPLDLDLARPLFLDILDIGAGRIIESIPLPTTRSVRPNASGPAVYHRCTQSLGVMSAPLQMSELAQQFLVLPCYDAEPMVELLLPRYVQPTYINSSVADEPPTRIPRAVPRVIALIQADGTTDTRTLLAEPDGECAAARMTSAATSGGVRFLVTTKPLPDSPPELAGKCGFRNMPFGNSGGADVVVNPDYGDLEAGALPAGCVRALMYGRLSAICAAVCSLVQRKYAWHCSHLTVALTASLHSSCSTCSECAVGDHRHRGHDAWPHARRLPADYAASQRLGDHF